jgi:DNA polymerase-3 subunit delta'
MDEWEVLVAARELAEAVRVPLEDVKAAQEALAEQNSDFLTPAALKELEARNKRELSARERSGMMEAIASAESLLRDVLVRCEGAGQLVNADVSHVVGRLASSLDSTQVLRALDACSQAADDLAHNVSPQLTLEVWLLNIKEAYACPA